MYTTTVSNIIATIATTVLVSPKAMSVLIVYGILNVVG